MTMTQPEPLTPAQILTGARSLLERGWCQNNWHRSSINMLSSAIEHRFCSMGAINQVSLGHPYMAIRVPGEAITNECSREQAVEFLARQIDPVTRFPEGTLRLYQAITQWNDALNFNQLPEVLHQFDLAAKVAKEGELS